MNFFDKKASFLTIMLVFGSLIISSQAASAQNPPEKQDPAELAEQETERLAKLLDLESWQVFYVDSTLQHDLTALQEEYDDMQKAKVSNLDLFLDVRDKWMQSVYDSYQRIFNEKQWAKYYKVEGARAQKARDKRREKAAGQIVKPK